MELLRAALTSLPRTAIVTSSRSYSYADLLAMALAASVKLASSPSTLASSSSSNGPRVAVMGEPGASYVAGSFAAWLHGGIAVPLCLSHPDRELQYVLEDSQAAAVLSTDKHAERLYRLAQPFGAEVHVVPEEQHGQPLEGMPAQQHGAPDPEVDQQQQQQVQVQVRVQVQERLAGQQPGHGALIVYTSGTTGRPKGALHTHASLAAMADMLCEAWEWEPQDRILHSLPLHHIHGIVNALYCPLRIGACVEMLPKFSPSEVWKRLQRERDPISVFMGVPTMYSHLLSRYDALDSDEQPAAAAAARRLRLAVSGSAACPEPVMRRWQQLSGQTLLERYGATETGMILGNPYRRERRPGTVGQPFAGVEARIVGSDGQDAGSGPGELRVKSPQLFREYWNRPDATAEAFDSEGFYRTGDTAVVEDGYFKLLGRTSVDIIKHGGYKISALGIESVLLEHPAIAEAAVLGLPDETYGERIAAVVALEKPGPAGSGDGGSKGSSSSSSGLELAELRQWAADRLPPYQLPAELRVVPAIPRNAMGKVNKKELRLQLFGGGGSASVAA